MMGSQPRRENEYDTLNRGTMMQECSSEYQLLQHDTMSTFRHRFMARNLGTQQRKEESNPAKVALKKILITMVVVNIMLVLLITVIAIAMAVLSYTRPTTREITYGISSLKTNMNQLTATFQTNISQILMQHEAIALIQTNLSQMLFQLNKDVLSVQQESASQQIQLYCGAGDWQRIVFINMSNASQQCPSAWMEFNHSGVRGCGRSDDCSANLYPVASQYSRVCGRLIGYQAGSPDGFIADQTIDAAYMDGVSITHGMLPRVHIWSYVAGVTERSSQHTPNNCPCSPEAGRLPQSFVGDNYFCESGNPRDDFERAEVIYADDPLWDGQQCEGSCCNNRNSTQYPPWFSVRLPATTNNTIEVRICGNEPLNNENTLIEVLELFVN